MKLNNLTKVLAVSAATALTSNAFAATAYDEIEKGAGQNDSVYTAEELPASPGYSIKGIIGVIGEGSMGDVDYYAFHANEGDTLNIDIDNGYDGAGSVDTILGIIEAKTSTLLDWNNNPDAIDAGSVSVADARLDKVTIPSTGTYIVAVSTYPRFFNNDGTVTAASTSTGPGPAPSSPSGPGSTDQGGDYTLNISGVTTRIKQINFEVKPGSKELAPLKPSSKGKVPVAIYGSSSFDVSSIDNTSLTFGSTGNEKSLESCQKRRQDINNDGYTDILCHFKNDKAAFKSGDLSAKMKGKTTSNEQFEGHALLKVLPSNRK